MYSSEQKLILETQVCKSKNQLRIFSSSPYSNVRSSVAKNPYTDSETLNKLAFDCVARVSYWALKNNKCTKKRILRSEDLEHKCVICKIDESLFFKECQQCYN